MRVRNPLFPPLFINADDIAKEDKLSAYEAAIEADRRRNDAILERLSFATETVMSTETKIDFIKKAKAAGYQVTLIYITTQDETINLERVKARVKMGGHDVPQEKTLARYKRSMTFLVEVLDIVDEASIFNNSFTKPVMIARKRMDGQIELRPQPRPSIWTEENIKDLLGVSDEQIDFGSFENT
jgi:predicted ABC-type ATPase